ncbi:unnamed protein product [Phyllotreta striolata]|uniref:chitinase n=1 Tax=Phyllotreta striolata TaxID=444603 RepID=A0A9N9TT97_PHYSR|nr:unnamed protein product [Phyllotreta striolata]
MRGIISLSAAYFILACFLISSANSYNIVCYFASWSIYRNLSGKFDVSNIDPNLCTHINFAFVELYENGSLYIVDPWESNSKSDGGNYNGFQDLVNLRQQNPNLNVLVSLGGWNEGSKNFSVVCADEAKRQILVGEVMRLIAKYNFDGLDIDWEYPTLRTDSHPQDKENFVKLLAAFRTAFQPRRLLLTAAVAGAVEKIDAAYFVGNLTNYLDMLNVMSYDYHGAFDGFVGHISPLYASSLDYKHEKNYTYVASAAIEHWLRNGADPSKINLGVPTYGRTFTLADKNNTQLYAPILGPGPKGLFTGLEGTLGYHEICNEYSGADSQYVFDDHQKVPHRVVDDLWIGYDDNVSLTYKVDYAVAQKLGGIMVYSIDTDDFLGLCGHKYILLTTIKNRLDYHRSK